MPPVANYSSSGSANNYYSNNNNNSNNNTATKSPKSSGEYHDPNYPSLFYTFTNRFEYISYTEIIIDINSGINTSLFSIILLINYYYFLNDINGINNGLFVLILSSIINFLFSGSKYIVYGPNYSLLPIILLFSDNYNIYLFIILLTLASTLSILLAYCRVGQYINKVPTSIITGIIIGLSLSFIVQQLPDLLSIGVNNNDYTNNGIVNLLNNIGNSNIYTLILGGVTVLLALMFHYINHYIPVPLIIIGVMSVIVNLYYSNNTTADNNNNNIYSIPKMNDRFPNVNNLEFNFNWIWSDINILSTSNNPQQINIDIYFVLDMIYYFLNIFLIITIESLLVGRVGDRLGNNRGYLFNNNKELIGNGINNICSSICDIVVPNTPNFLLTIMNIKTGAITPISLLFKLLCTFLFVYVFSNALFYIPLAVISGVIIYYAIIIIRFNDIYDIITTSVFHTLLLIWTTTIVLFVDIITAVLTGLFLFLLFAPSTNNSNTSEKRPLLGGNRMAPAGV